MKIGKSAQENWNLLSESQSDDLWFHLDSFPSPYVILEKENISKGNVKIAAECCKQNSKYRNLRNIKVVYCEIRNLSKGNKVGEVIIKSRRQCKLISV